jgi:HlyD family secretion protein
MERELISAKQSAETSRRILDAFTLQKKIFRQYEYPQQLATKLRAKENSEIDLKKAQVSAEQEAKQKAIEVKGVEALIKKLTAQVDRLNDYLTKCVVTAPVDGLVIYGDSSMPAYYYDRGQIRVGMDWYGSNVLMTIPDLSAFEVDINVPEEYRGRISEGLPVLVTVEAVPGLVIKGKLKTISQLGRPRGYDYDGGGARFFTTAISLDKNDTRMVSGMTAKVEIVADTASDVLAVPIEAVFNDGENSVCYLKETSGTLKRRVKPGRRNANLVEITEGLNDGELVSLVEPAPSGPTTKPVKK